MTRYSRRWLLLLLAFQVVVAGLAFAVWIWTPNAPPTPSLPTAGLTPIARPASFESAFPLAWEQARAWNPDARLLSATLQVDWPWDPVPPGVVTAVPGTGWITFVFVAPWQPPGRGAGAASLSVVVERLSGRILQQSSLGWEYVPATPIAVATPLTTIPSTTAVLVAEAAGGASFRRACPPLRHVTRVALETDQGYPPHWLITYEDSRAPDGHGLRVRVDAITAEVLEVDQAAPAC